MINQYINLEATNSSEILNSEVKILDMGNVQLMYTLHNIPEAADQKINSPIIFNDYKY